MIGYKQVIDEIVKVRNLNLDEVLAKKNGAIVTLKDFIKKSEKMTPWHSRLIDNLSDIQARNGDILRYLKEYTEEKMKSGFSFTEKEKEDRVEIKISLRNKNEMHEFFDIIQGIAERIRIKICKSGIVITGKEIIKEENIPGDLLVSIPLDCYELQKKLEKFA